MNLSRLEQIAKVVGMKLWQLFASEGKNIFNLADIYNTQGDNWNVNFHSIEQIEYKHELEKANLMIEEREKEIDYLKQQINDFRDIINLLKKREKQE